MTKKLISSGIDFPGWDPSISCLVADVQMEQEPEWGMHRDPGPFHSFFDFGEGTVRVVVTESSVRQGGDPTLRDLCDALVSARGTVYGMHSPKLIAVHRRDSAGGVLPRQESAAGRRRRTRPFPDRRQGLNTGIQDAVNLVWKLAQIVNGTWPESFLDTYHAERHPVAARVLHNTMGANR